MTQTCPTLEADFEFVYADTPIHSNNCFQISQSSKHESDSRQKHEDSG